MLFKRPPIRGVLVAEVGMGVGVLALVFGLFCGEVAGVAGLHGPAPSKLGEESERLVLCIVGNSSCSAIFCSGRIIAKS